MSVTDRWTRLAGAWSGKNRLWLMPEDPVRESASTASLAVVAQGRFLVLRYTWADEGRPQDGVLLIGLGEPEAAIDATWVDSWHMGNKILRCQGAAGEDGSLAATGSYAAPHGPDWGWRIVLRPGPDDAFQMLMYNITPEGEEALAVEATYADRS